MLTLKIVITNEYIIMKVVFCFLKKKEVENNVTSDK